MDLRQRGVAHVNIFWSLVPLVLMLAAAGYAYIKHTEADENRAAKIAAEKQEAYYKDRFAHREQQLKELTDVLGNAGKFTEPLVAIENYTPPSAYTTPAKLTDAFTAFATRMGQPTSLNKLDDIFNAAGTVLKAHTDQIASLETQLRDVRTQLTAAKDATDAVRNDKDTKITTLEGSLKSERNRIDQQAASHSRELADARKKTRDANAATETAIKTSNAKIAAKDVELRDMTATAVRRGELVKLINSPSQPDGRILSASPSTGLAWIDLGAKDMVKTGLTFRILEPSGNGKMTLKGHGMVTKVENDRAQIKVTNLVNALNPVVRNDFIANDLYSRGLKRNVYLLGRFATPYSKGEIKRILENMGNTVSGKMDPTVDLVIVGRQPIGAEDEVTKLEDTEEFKNAVNWNVEIATLVKIRDFLRL